MVIQHSVASDLLCSQRHAFGRGLIEDGPPHANAGRSCPPDRWALRDEAYLHLHAICHHWSLRLPLLGRWSGQARGTVDPPAMPVCWLMRKMWIAALGLRLCT
jgi:hypothetical protein